MKLPQMAELAQTRQMVDTFKGYNHNLRIAENEFYDMKNLTSDYFPVLSPRAKRGKYNNATNANGLIAKESLCYVNGTKFYVNGNEVSGLTLTDSEKTLTSMGAYVIIMPDKKWVNTSTQSYGDIEAYFPAFLEPNPTYMKISNCKSDGTVLSGTIPASDTPNPSPEDKEYWIDTSMMPHTLKQWSAQLETWVAQTTTFVRIDATNIGKNFLGGDAVNVSLFGQYGRTDVTALNGSHILTARSNNYIVFTGIVDSVYEEEGDESNPVDISVNRRMPDMDFVIESGNRLWGCKYGTREGLPINEIYASKLGDFKNWNVFEGISTDSYVASVGTDGAFTGAYTFLGHPHFFKEDCVHKVYGNFPSNFQIQTTAIRGVEKGSDKSIALVNETLFYKGKSGIIAYDGSLPTDVSSAFGEVRYRDAVGGSHDNKYYVSMKDGNGVYSLFVLDVAKGLWHKEDNTRADAFCPLGSELYYIDHKSKQGTVTKSIKTMFGSGTQDMASVSWMAETGMIMIDRPDSKYVSAINVRMSLAVGSTVSLSIQYDSIGDFEQAFRYESTTLRSFSMPITPHRCDHIRIRIEGIGDAKIYSITSTIENGSDT